MENLIYHISSETEAAHAQETGEYEPKAFAAEGFIHCSYAHQLESVLNRIFQGRTDLVVFEIDPALLSCKIIDENLEGGIELFPHVYGRLPMSAVVRIQKLSSV